MRQFSTVELLRDLKSVTHAAARAPVAITQHGKARFVLMAIEDFERLKTSKHDPRRALLVEDTPAEFAHAMVHALDEIIAGEPDDSDS
jgi:prevent-host-death family protein